ncbi:MAG: hypothetical protein HC880_22100 [Bacteroidia bacterium]|nr:hypothetical protein [Bacteroidia bacterium]
MGKLARKTQESSVRGQVQVGNQAAQSFNGQDLILNQNLPGSQVNIRAEGQGSLYYFWEMSGLSADGRVKESDNKMKVRKTFYDQKGNIIKDLVFKQNDLVIVEVSILAEPYFRQIENVVVSDIIPAGI